MQESSPSVKLSTNMPAQYIWGGVNIYSIWLTKVIPTMNLEKCISVLHVATGIKLSSLLFVDLFTYVKYL